MKQFSKLLFAVVLLGLGVQAHAHNLNWAVGIVDCDTQTLALKFQVDGFRDNYDYQVHYELFDSSGALFAAGDTVVFQGNGGAGGTEGRAFAVTPYAVVDVSGVSGVITGEASLVQLTGSAPGALPYTWGLNPDPIQGRNPAYRDGVDFPRNGDPVPLLIDCQPTLCSIGDFVWVDLNRDGLQTGELAEGLGGITVNITDGVGFAASTATAADGSYAFTGLACDTTYTVSVADPDPTIYQRAEVDAGLNGNDAIDSDNHDGASSMPTTANPDDDTIDFGYELIPASLGDFVWLDADQDGLQGPLEPGLAGIDVVLKDCNLVMIPGKQTQTAADGSYLFDNLDPGTYVVMVMAPGGYSFTTMDANGNASDGIDSDVDPGTGNTNCITLSPGEHNDTVDAGLFEGAGLGNYVWHDLNANGIQDDGNTGIAGVDVELLDCSMNSFNPAVTTTTDALGGYSFNGLAAGCYFVMFSQPAGFDKASPTGQGTFATDSDAGPGGKTMQIDLLDGQFDDSWDAGFYKSASLGDRVWSDLNRNGLQDLNEAGLVGCTVNLQGIDNQGNNVDLFDTTDANGDYLFENLVPGEYMVQFSNDCTDNWVYTLQNANDPANDDIDSDANGSGKTAGYTLASGDDNRTVDAGLHAPAAPSITIEKATSATQNDPNAEDADLPTGPFIPFNDTVYWTYVVKNDGNRDLTNVKVMDDNGTPGVLFDDFMADCPQDTLAVNESMTCTASKPGAILGQYANVGKATGEDADQAMVMSDDPSHYFGANPGVDIEKATNGFDADSPDTNVNPIPVVPVGDAVTWTYVVTNTGNVTLTNIEVSDNEIFPPVLTTCPTTTLAAGADMTCTVVGTAVDTSNMNPPYGVFENVAAVSAEGPPGAGNPPNDSDPSHYIGGIGSIDIEKATNGVDADDPNAGDAPQIAAGDPVSWTYVVTNKGNVTVNDIAVTDDQGVAVSCPQTTLVAGESMICTASGIADDLNNTGFTTVPGRCGSYPNTPLYENKGRATGLTETGDFVEDVDASHYCNPPMPRINIEKATNGVDADDPNAGDAPQIAAGDPVSWTYVVTNTGNVTVNDIAVTDDQGVAVSCPQTTLVAGDSMNCTANGLAEDLNNTGFTTVPGMCGQIPNTPMYENMGRATGTTTTGDFVEDVDASHYCNPQVPSIDIEKATDDRNGVPQDADTPRGPGLLVGSTVNWTYVVTNTGNVELTGVTVLDDQPGVAVSCPMDTLAAGASMTCTASGLATKGQYENLGSVTGTPPVGDDVSDSDPSHYFGLDPQIDIEKATNGEDADAPTGPGIPVGGTATFTYVVDNPSNEGIKNVMVIDDQGVTVSPVDINPADGFNDGDLDKDNVLDFNETWSYTGSTTVTAGQYTNIGSVTGLGNNTNKPVSDADPSNHFGLTPSINIRKQKEGPDTRTYVTGSSVTFTIVVENTGPVALTDVVVSDLKASQCNNVIGDLAVGGFATYDCTIPVVNGSFVNEACVTGVGGNQQVGDCDPSTVEIIDINISKEAEGPDSRTFSPGDDVTFAIVVTNTGSEDLSNVVVTDQLAPQCNRVIGPLAAGASFPYNCTVQSIDAGFENVACVEGSRNDVTVGDCDPSTVVLLEICELTLDKMCFVTPPPPSSNFQCDKPIDSLTMIWTGGNTVWVKAWKGSVGSTSLGVKSVAPGEEVTFTGFAGSPNDVFWEVFSDAGLNNKIGESKFHLSCSDDDMDGPEDCGKFEGNGKDNSGSFINLWKLEGMVDAKNTLDCTVDDTPVFADACEFTGQPLPSCENGDKPDTLTWRYDGGTGGDGDCADSTFYTIVDENGDGHDDFMCSGSVDTSQPITVTDDNGDTYVVNPGDEFTMSRSEIGSMTLSQNGSVVQTMAFHASCSQVLEANATAGALRLVALDDRRGDQEVQYAYTVTNNSAGAVSNIDVTDDKLGDIGSIASLDGNGGSMTLYEQAFITATTTNTAMAVGDLVGIDDCVAPNDSVTVTVTEPPKSCATHNKPTSLTFDVTGSCSDQDNFQDGKAKCTGPDLTGDVVSIVINKDANKIGATVVNGDTIKVFQTDKIGESLQSTVKFTITDSNGNSQYHEVHTSCSQPLAEGDLLGGIRLVVYEPAYN